MLFSQLDRWAAPRAKVPHGRESESWEIVRLGDLVTQVTDKIIADDDTAYSMAGVRWYAGGVFHRETVLGKDMSARHVTPLKPGALVYNRLFAWKESFAVVTPEHNGLFVSNEFPQFMPDTSRVLPEFLYLFCTTPSTTKLVNAASAGSAAVSRNRFKESEFTNFELRLPPLATQRAIIAHWRATMEKNAAALKAADENDAAIRQKFLKALGLSARRAGPTPRFFAARWSDVDSWNCKSIHLRLSQGDMRMGRYPVVNGRDCIASVQHGCSQGPSTEPTTLEVLKISAATRGEYDRNQRKFIADSEQIRRNFELLAGDVLMCRTNGTLDYVGMSALILEDEPNLIFPDKLIRVRANKRMLPEFLWLVLQMPPLRAQIETAARTAVGNYAIGGSDIWNFEFPLPPLSIQKKLVAEVIAGREQSADKRAAAAKRATDTALEVEEMILGLRPVSTSATH